MPSDIAVEKKKLKNPPLQMHYLGDRVLRQPAKRVTKIDDELRQIVREMLKLCIAQMALVWLHLKLVSINS